MGVDYTAICGIGFYLKEGILLDDNVKAIMQAQLEDGDSLERYDLFESLQSLLIHTDFQVEEVGERAYVGNSKIKNYGIMVILSNPFSKGFDKVPGQLQKLRDFLNEKGITYIDTKDEDSLIYDILIS